MEEIIDLTFNMEEGMLTFNAPWHVPFAITQLGRHGVEGRETRQVSFGTHTGTQVDAPLHFVAGGASIDSVPLDHLLGPVSIYDFSFLGENDCLTVGMLENLNITKRIIFRFGWEKYWPTRKYYRGYPWISNEAARYLVAKNVKMIGFDTPSPDDSRIQLQGELLGTAADSPAHKIFLSQGVALVEYLANLGQLRDLNNWNIAALPIKLKGADGAPARVCLFR